jgi:hypothetical protein
MVESFKDHIPRGKKRYLRWSHCGVFDIDKRQEIKVEFCFTRNFLKDKEFWVFKNDSKYFFFQSSPNTNIMYNFK